ncbi:GNAT family N-acetyltransferase [Streptomyces sp. NPDC004609]|uniref:GNAT family N-acetyltransferase n=1 Tax=Streptomyces sp. NPDC004609 TaxID=3364704 RepID=UPI0036ACD8D6
MTTTLRPTGPLQPGTDGARTRSYEVCVNSRPVGGIEIATLPACGAGTGTVRSLWIDPADRRRGRGTVAALAAEEVLRGWGCGRVEVSVPADAAEAVRLATVLGYTERGRDLLKVLDTEPPAPPPDTGIRPMTEPEFREWWPTAVEAYARGWTERGLPDVEARARSEAHHRALVDPPGGRPEVLVHRGEAVGRLLVGPNEVRPGERGAYVYDIEVAEGHRGRGHGRALMHRAESRARESGARLIGLHVVAGDTRALGFYESLGYRTADIHLVKRLL